jgi:hypothetical protein
MASSGKKRTTMAKLTRESKLRERRATKKARKDDRKRNPPSAVDLATGDLTTDDFATDDAPETDVDGQPVDSGAGVSD